MLLCLCVLAVIGIYAHGVYAILPQVLISTAASSFSDIAVRFARARRWTLPTGPLISGLIIALLLPANAAWYISLVAALLAMSSKHVLKIKGRNLFNPAALSVAASMFVFPEGFRLNHSMYLEAGPSMYFAQSYLQLNDWTFLLLGGHGWPASTSLVGVVTLGTVLLYRLRRVEQVPTFLVTYVLAFTIFAYVTGQDIIVRILLEVFPSGLLFFSFFMLTDPPTSPATRPSRALYGSLTALLCFVFRFVATPVQFLLFALLAANVFAAGIKIRATK